MCVCMGVPISRGTNISQMLIPLELELQALLSCLTMGLRIELSLL